MIRRLVLIDDTAALREMIAEILEADGRFQVVGQAGDGLEGLEVVAACTPDIVVLDLMMPVMDGLTCARELAHNHPGLPVVILTSTTSATLGAQAREAGAVAVVAKGMTLDPLIDTLLAVELPDPQDDSSA